MFINLPFTLLLYCEALLHNHIAPFIPTRRCLRGTTIAYHTQRKHCERVQRGRKGQRLTHRQGSLPYGKGRSSAQINSGSSAGVASAGATVTVTANSCRPLGAIVPAGVTGYFYHRKIYANAQQTLPQKATECDTVRHGMMGKLNYLPRYFVFFPLRTARMQLVRWLVLRYRSKIKQTFTLDASSVAIRIRLLVCPVCLITRVKEGISMFGGESNRSPQG